MSTTALPARRAGPAGRRGCGPRRSCSPCSRSPPSLSLWDLTISGYSNEYYAAAARAGERELEGAGSSARSTPAASSPSTSRRSSLWLMGLSARVFGFSSFAILLPQALCTIAAVGAAVRDGPPRRSAGAAGLLAGAALALTPITVAIARVNNPDALLVLLLVASAYLHRPGARGRPHEAPGCWRGVVVGLAFMTKMLQGWMIVPALAAAYLLAGPPRLADPRCASCSRPAR